jgi:hypothetical protein
MDWEKLWDILKKIAVISNIGAFVLAVVWFLYEIWPSSPSRWRAFDTEAGMRPWLPSLIIGGCLVLASIFNLVAFSISRRKRKLQKQIAELTQQKTELASQAGQFQRAKGLCEQNYRRLEKERDSYSSELAEAKPQIESLKIELAQVKKDADNANKRAKFETNQREEFIKAYHEASRKLADLEWLRLIAVDQAKNISEHVKVGAVTELYKLCIDKAPRRVLITLRIKNESVFDVAIAKTISGRLHHSVALNEPARLLIDSDHPAIENLKPDQEAMLTVEQPLLESEGETIRDLIEDADTKFWLGNLSIPILITPDYLEGKTRILTINSEIEHVHPKQFGKSNTPDRAWQAIAEADGADVSRSVFVAVRGVNFDLLMSEKRLDFMFEVFNGSVFPVSISARSNGFVQHDGKYLSQYTVFDPAQSDDLQRGQRTVVTLRHERIEPEKCSALQADFDAEKPIEFDFGGLTLPVRITDPNGTGKPSRLVLPDGIFWRKGSAFGRIVKAVVSVNSTSDASLKPN